MESKDKEMDFFIAVSIAKEYFPNFKNQQHNYYYTEFKDSAGDEITFTLIINKVETPNDTRLWLEQKSTNWYNIDNITEAEWRESLALRKQRILSDNPFAFEDMYAEEECKW